jgi:hypothetical protein
LARGKIDESPWNLNIVFIPIHQCLIPFLINSKERSILLKLDLTTPFTTSWTSSADHCTWYGVTCEEDWENKTASWFRVTELDFNNTQWTESYFQEYQGFTKLETLRTNQNSLGGYVSDALCSVSKSTDLHIVADETNCPNKLTEDGCCDEVKLTVPSPYLDSIVQAELGSAECGTLSSSDAKVCEFMKHKNNHVVFQVDELYPSREDFDYETWLKERIVLTQIFYGTSLETTNPAWLNTGDHCNWAGVTCNENSQVTDLIFSGLGLTGPYPTTLGKLSQLKNLDTKGNTLVGVLDANDICTNSFISGDETNCPNAVDETGCCDFVRMTSPSPYLDGIAVSELGSSDCTGSDVCTFLTNKDNHYVFDDGQYPDGFPYKEWLKVSLDKHLFL